MSAVEIPTEKMTDEQFFEFCLLHKGRRIERTAQGEIEIMAPAGGSTGRRNFKLSQLFGEWEEQDGTGLCFESSTGFILPNGAERSPDVAWVTWERWEQLTDQQQEKFPPLCPDFVAELRSPSDSLEKLKAKMEEFLANGARLGWLIDPHTKQVYVYRPDVPVECLDNPDTISGEPVLRGFTLDLQRVWQAVHRRRK